MERVNVKEPIRMMWVVWLLGPMDETGISDLRSKGQSRRQSGLTEAENSHRAVLGREVKEYREDQSVGFSKILLSETRHRNQGNFSVGNNGPRPYLTPYTKH